LGAAQHDVIAGHGYVLPPGCYVGAEDVEEASTPFPERFAALQAHLKEQFAASVRLTEVIRQRLANVIVPAE
jgi:type I restriction enzyme M protein